MRGVKGTGRLRNTTGLTAVELRRRQHGELDRIGRRLLELLEEDWTMREAAGLLGVNERRAYRAIRRIRGQHMTTTTNQPHKREG